MEEILKGLKPESVFKHFETLTRIPRGSGNEKEVSDYLVQFAKDRNLEVIQDESLNVIIKKPGTKGYESSKRVILQGHMDIVCVKRDDLEFDFLRDPIPIVVEDDYIKTRGTTLGADNGIAVAMGMAILDSNVLEHPPLTVLITIEEETGMIGVKNLEEGSVEGDILINIDSEEEGVLLASCAGGVRNIVSLPIEYKESRSDVKTYEVMISGLLGGHSGMEINKKRASAIKLMGRLLDALDQKVGIDISRISGGDKMNAIPKMTKATLSVSSKKFEQFEGIINEYDGIFSKEFEVADPNIKISIRKVDTKSMVFTDITKRNLIAILRLLPFGPQTMSANIEGLVESSNNIGVLEMENDQIILSSAVRSSVNSLKTEITDRIETICNLTGASMQLVSSYPEWEYKVDSEIRDIMLNVYKDMFGKNAKIEAIHAGLECGFLKQKVGDIDMISIGPNIYDVHTPLEHISISSTRRVYEFLCEVLKNIK
ncbi:aminoacyl-histidine dipeptidase [Haloplasma contractile]|uniref:Cytosol non-specific dipeptidase n=1 Tax=Haloplasma contractile SSD-17B TaxID=1033810 RepID=U2FQ50_9MOLU|nr:aminoacyl-histidine dipeptidase [Haloplasma contractile]ERJ13174.1 Aminoacyl-histidine dipeptidase protein [Haloplasma contractile SSD-17B]